ncbi:MotY family protein [Ferrimonas marina]|uniref:OmpA family protein n=1 Tax=Ferrimonas marina TaxID=299255 RepID=A0A1M5R1W2_9GAMM|nr:OmpA family protein [Ferrimonas marina]SHH20030.1 OmpA family protein [Ferrimonas marina]
MALGAVAKERAPAQYATAIDGVDWHFQGDRFGCQLTHAVDGFGTLAMSRQPGQPMVMTLQADWLAEQPKATRSNLRSPVWLHQQPGQSLSRDWQWQGQHGRLEAGSTGYLDALEQGWGIGMTLSLADGRDYQLEIEPVSVKRPLREFRACAGQVVPQPYSVVRHVTFQYAPGQMLPAATKAQLVNAIAAYVDADRRVAEVLIDGHSDNVGDHLANLVLSRQRADELSAMLVEQGVPESMIEVRGHGQRYPLVSNATASGRNKNRRVEVRLVLAKESAHADH